MIEARNVTKFFSVVNDDRTADGTTAVLSVSLSIPDGRFVSFLGPSGCGKSTFLEILAGLQAPTEGEVWIDGRRVLEPLPATRKEMEAYRRKYRFLSPIANSVFRDKPKHDIAMIFQDYAVFPWMTALQNVVFTLKLRGAYFAVITYGLGELVKHTITHIEKTYFGTVGRVMTETPSSATVYWTVLVVAALAVWTYVAFGRSRWGHALRGIGMDEERAATMGQKK